MFSWVGLVSSLVGLWNRLMDWFKSEQSRADGAREAEAVRKEAEDERVRRANEARSAAEAVDPDSVLDTDPDVRD